MIKTSKELQSEILSLLDLPIDNVIAASVHFSPNQEMSVDVRYLEGGVDAFGRINIENGSVFTVELTTFIYDSYSGKWGKAS